MPYFRNIFLFIIYFHISTVFVGSTRATMTIPKLKKMYTDICMPPALTHCSTTYVPFKQLQTRIQDINKNNIPCLLTQM